MARQSLGIKKGLCKECTTSDEMDMPIGQVKNFQKVKAEQLKKQGESYLKFQWGRKKETEI
jgi:hypothetical protein